MPQRWQDFSFSANKHHEIAPHDTLKHELFVSGAFWAKQNDPEAFYVPIPRHRIIGEDKDDEWKLNPQRKWERDSEKLDLEVEYRWQRIDAWQRNASKIRKNKEMSNVPWEPVSFLHPHMKQNERHVLEKDGLFLENAVQMDEDCCLVYLSTYPLPDGWYRFGGEGHMVEICSKEITPDSTIHQLLSTKIQKACALITPGAWGSNHLSYRYPKHSEFPKTGMKMLTDKPIPYRYRTGHRSTERGRLGRGRYAVPAGTVYVFKQALEKTWWDFPEAWFPKEGFPLKHLGCGLCLPVEIDGVI
ncbi:type III-B CRISPR module-associated protein Cmr3 [Phormidesmis priestleyi]|uniref:type III-B CRISPR module-associated protein Cmr3 n=1 Tax=Phormidesmis priestleyi TaxID=268141 RepID=UPI000AE379EA|nr:type III-B CRISPR module-associated protein Cmr3 [Phormidesmis priestleyi]